MSLPQTLTATVSTPFTALYTGHSRRSAGQHDCRKPRIDMAMLAPQHGTHPAGMHEMSMDTCAEAALAERPQTSVYPSAQLDVLEMDLKLEERQRRLRMAPLTDILTQQHKRGFLSVLNIMPAKTQRLLPAYACGMRFAARSPGSTGEPQSTGANIRLHGGGVRHSRRVRLGD